ncbi:hypothetical protein C0585_08120 [Candidatus Woesearchaeota archaeon]|nr:MAG: hypothetical protein C0585_08120 [Candidatus Woesearchaeota archaeon]
MRIKKLVLDNIRSYRSETINFPDGSILLQGDIGSGKSTILLSIEFALFGFRRQDLSGSTLLRHGESNGGVELHFEIEKNKIIIKRTLKRTNNAIKQEAGYIIINDSKHDLTPIELKSKILDLLGYPEDLLSKTKESIYRYTVYTPQESMKQIVFADVQERLDILRRVFGIDKYKRIKENLAIYLKETKKKMAYQQGAYEGMEELQKELANLEKESTDAKKVLIDLESRSKESKEALEKKDLEFKEYSKKISEYESHKSKIDVINQKIVQIENISIRNKKKKEEYVLNLDAEKKKIEGKTFDVSKLSKFLDELNIKKKDLEEKRSELSQKKAVSNSKINDSKNLTSKIASIDNCPMCMQEVGRDHKESIRNDSKKIIDISTEKIVKIDLTLKKIEHNLEIISKKAIDTQEKINGSKALDIIKKSIEDKEKELKSIIHESTTLEKEILELKKQKETLTKDLSEKDYDKEKLANLESEKKITNEKYQSIILEKARYEEKSKNFSMQNESLKNRINKKKESKKKYERLNSHYDILESKMLPLISSIEKQVMGTIYYEFNSLLSKWFNLLIDEELLSIRIDHEFSPILEQNGYETTIDNLSGGEKTAVALSYRLALNQVINDLVNTINTKDFLILDEPTDGFSSEQLEKLNEVIKELAINQLIIVSHDQKIEGFVENHINIAKSSHESSIASLN